MKALIVGVGVCCVLLGGCASGDTSSGSAEDGSTTIDQLQSSEADVVGPGEEKSADCTARNTYSGSADLHGCDLSGADLTAASLGGANLTGANLSGAKMYGVDLQNANLTDANLTDANPTHAILTGAILTGANLTGADLTDSNLVSAKLPEANLTRANLTKARLYENILTGVIWSNTTCPNGVVQSKQCPED